MVSLTAAPASELEAPLSAVEQRLSALGLALHRQDADAVEREAAALHTALATAVGHFSRAARHGSVPPALRHRLALAGGRVAAQREALARATASLDRAIDVLLPGAMTPVTPSGSAALYTARGAAARSPGHGGLLA